MATRLLSEHDVRALLPVADRPRVVPAFDAGQCAVPGLPECARSVGRKIGVELGGRR